ncbi:MAG: WbqC family protein [Pseudomonadota bacterium]
MNRSIAIMQPYFFPYIGYFQLITAVDKYILYDNLNFIKYGWVNRNKVLVKNSGTTYITVPLKHKSSFELIKNIETDESVNWREKILKTISLNYQKAPMFQEVYPLIEECINLTTNKLSILNSNLIINICNYLKINTPIESNSGKYQFIENLLLGGGTHSNECYSDNSIDKKVARIFEVCKYEKANIFYNAIGGTQLYSKILFSKNHIELKFIKTASIVYKQFNNDFIPSLSIIDVMMFNPVDAINSLLNNYELI